MKKIFVLFLLGPLFAQEIELPDITLFIEKPVAEQKIVMKAEEIKEKNVESLTGLLQSAGIQILSYGPYGLESKPSIRGFTDETVRVIIDGICVNNEQYGTFDFSSININSIEKIEIVKGGFTEGVSDEGAVGGAIYITTKSQTYGQHYFSDSFFKTYFNANALVDTIGEKLSGSWQLGEAGFFKAGAAVTWAQNLFLYNEKLYGNLVERKNADVLDGSGEIKYSHYFGGGNVFSIGEMFYGGNKSTPGPEHGSSGNQQDYDNNLTLNLRFPHMDNGLSVDSTLCWLSNIRFYTAPGENSKHYVNSIKLAVAGEYSGSDFYSQALGLTFDYTNLNSSNDGYHNQFTGTLKDTRKFKAGDIFSFSVPLAVKFCNSNVAFIPKFGVRADFEYFSLIADGYRMVQFPNMDDLYWIGAGYKGNPDLIPEDGWGGDLGFSLKNLPVSADVTFFTNYYRNKIQWAGSENGWMPQNIASAFYAGVDVSMGTDFFDNRLALRCNGEYLYTSLLGDKNSLTYGKKIMWTPDWTAGFSAMLNLENFSLNLEGNYVGTRYTSNMNITRMEPYLLVNASGELKIWKNFIPYFRADNVLNVQYQAVEDYPMPGISLTLGAKLMFDYE